jgi:hypothetical protein
MMVLEKGIVPSPSIKGQSGYISCFRHYDNISLPVAKFSHKILENIPGIPYDVNNIHTTIFTHDVKNTLEFIPDNKIIEKISERLVHNVYNLKRWLPPPSINYGEWLNNQDTLIFGGIPNESFVNYTESLVNDSYLREMNIKMPWGAHITAFRFSKELKVDEMESYFKCFEKTPNGLISFPTSIDIGYFILSPQGFMLKTLERFRLN